MLGRNSMEEIRKRNKATLHNINDLRSYFGSIRKRERAYKNKEIGQSKI